jgi:hypothetical protein
MLQNSIQEIVELQMRLHSAYETRNPAIKGNKWMVGLPAKTTLDLDQEIWIASKHGAGIRYVRSSPSPHLVIDSHDYPESTRRVDALRLQEFLHSKNVPMSFEEIESQLEIIAKTGALVPAEARGYLLQNQ